MYEICSMPAMRPRIRAGMVSFQMVTRNRPLTMSAAPAQARHAIATGRERAAPRPTIATAHSAAAITIAAPRRRTRPVQPLRTVTARLPALIAEKR